MPNHLTASDLSAALIILLLCAFALVGLDQSWDAIAYHLPYAALRTGIVTPQDFLLSPGFQNRYDGFPAFIDLVQGGLWQLFDTPKAAALVAPLAIIPLAIYARLALRLPAILIVTIFLAVPILHTALQAAYVDLWTNAFFSLHLAAAWTSLQPGTKRPKLHIVVSLLALGIAVNSKQQFYVIGALSGVLYAGLIMIDIRKLGWQALAVAVVLAPLVAAAPLLNLIHHGNPLYPMSAPALGLAGPEAAYFPAGAGEPLPQPVRYVLSMFEWYALSHRRMGYNIDQGEAEGHPGYHMGGSSGILLFVTLAMLAMCLRRTPLTSGQKRIAGAFAVLVMAVAFFPGSNELRYFSFVEIVAIIAVLCLLQRVAASPESFAAGLQAWYRLTLIGSALFIGFMSGFTYVRPHPVTLARAIQRGHHVNEELAAALAQSNVICYARFDANPFLYVDVLHPEIGHEYQIVEGFETGICPPGSAILK